MILPNGITGFSNKDNQTLMDGKEFKQISYSIIGRNGGQVLDFTEPHITQNFFTVKAKIFNDEIYILLNQYYPYLAFASDLNGKITFIDQPELSEQFSAFYNVLDKQVLNGAVLLKLGSKMILQNDNELNRTELDQIAYWRPERIGEIIYNFGD